MEKKESLRRIGYFVVAAGLTYWAVQHFRGKAQGPHAQSVEVTVVTLKPQDIRPSRELPGRVQPHKVAQVRPQVSGIILKRTFEEGGFVKAGQQLYQVDPAPFQAAYESALANLEKAKASLATNQAKVNRYKALLRIGGVSHQDYDDAVAAFMQSKADVGVAKASVTSAKIDLNYTKMYAPISGRIGRSFVTQGALVTSNQTDALAVIYEMDPIFVDVTASLSDLRVLRPGSSKAKALEAQATLSFDNEGESYAHMGKVAFDEVSVDEGTGTVAIRLHFPNPDAHLMPGMFVRARLEAPTQKGVLLIPQKTLIRQPDGSTTVWCVGQDQKAYSQKITIGEEVGTQWKVVSGLKPGDRVVVQGLPKMQPGASVKAVEEGSKTPSNHQDKHAA